MQNDSKEFKPNALTLITILLSSMVILMGAATVAPALNYMGQYFGIDDGSTTALVIALPALSVAIFGFLMGFLADRFGKAKVLFISLAIFTVMGVLPFFLNDFMLILVCRFLLGIGLTGISSTSTALIGEYWTGMQRVKVIGYQSAAIGVGTLVLETVGGVLADVGWNYPYLIYLIGVVIILTGIVSIREPRHSGMDLSESAEVEIPNRSRKILFCYLAVFAEMFIMFSMPTNFSYYIPQVAPDIADMTGFWAGLLLGVMGISQAVFSLFYSRSAKKLSEFMAYAIAFLMMAIGMGLMYVPMMFEDPTLILVILFVSMIFVGSSLGLLMPSVIGGLSRLSTVKTSGKVMGGYAVFLNISTFLAGVIIPVAYEVLDHQYTNVFGVLAIIALVIFVLLFVTSLIANRKKKEVPAAPIVSQTVVADKPMSTDFSMYSTILVPTDGSENSNFAVQNAINIAKKNRSSITAMFVVDVERYAGLGDGMFVADKMREAGIETSKAALDYVVDLAKVNGIDVVTKIVFGRPAEEIINESKNADLVVCGSLGRTNLNRALMGSVAETVVRMAYCPVLVCRRTNN